MTNIVEQLFKYRNQRPEAKLGEQLYAIPQKEDKMIKGQVYYYENPDSRLRTAVDFTKEVCIELRYEHMQLLVPKEYKALQESRNKVQTLIGKGYIRPFCLMLNGKFIPWKYIELICVTEKYYMLVSGIPQATFDANFFGVLTSIGMIRLPEDITYIDNANGTSVTDDRTIFAFSKDGTFVPEGEAAYLIRSDDDYLSIVSGNPDEEIFTISEDLKYAYFPEYIFTFNGITEVVEEEQTDEETGETIIVPVTTIASYDYDTTAEIATLGSYARIYGSNEYTYARAFFNTRGTPTYDHMHKVSTRNIVTDIKRALKEEYTPPYMDLLRQKFTVPYTVLKDWATNRKEGLNYIAEYDSRLFNEFYKDQKKFIVRSVDYTWVMSHLNEDGVMCIPRRFTLHHNFYILVFVNGLLAPNNGTASYVGSDYLMPVDGLQEGDDIEIWYFIGAKNYEYEMNLDVNEPYLPLDQDFFYIENDMALFCQETPRTNFSYPAKGLQNFNIGYSIQDADVDDSRNIRVKLDNAWYYTHDLVMTSKNRFAHRTIHVTTSTPGAYADFYRIDLGTAFMYCNIYDRYMVFYNGRRLSNDHYRLVLPCDDGFPFYRYQIYIAKPMKDGDVIDVVYLPHYCVDVYSADTDGIAANGVIEVPKNRLWTALDNELYTFWVNGRKLPSSSIMPLGENKVQLLEDPKSLKTLRVTLMLEYDDAWDELKDRFLTYTSYWDRILSQIDPAVLMDFQRPALTDDEEDHFSTTFPVKALMKELVRDWYICNTYVDCTRPIYYGYRTVDTTLLENVQYDSAHIELLEVAESNTSDNLDVERPYSE